MRARCVVVESLEQNELVRVLNATGPLEELVAFLSAGCLGESAGLLDPLVSVFGLDGELYSNKIIGTPGLKSRYVPFQFKPWVLASAEEYGLRRGFSCGFNRCIEWLVWI